MILQETLFEPRALLEQTVADTMTQTLEIRDAILSRMKKLRYTFSKLLRALYPEVYQG